MRRAGFDRRARREEGEPHHQHETTQDVGHHRRLLFCEASDGVRPAGKKKARMTLRAPSSRRPRPRPTVRSGRSWGPRDADRNALAPRPAARARAPGTAPLTIRVSADASGPGPEPPRVALRGSSLPRSSPVSGTNLCKTLDADGIQATVATDGLPSARDGSRVSQKVLSLFVGGGAPRTGRH